METAVPTREVISQPQKRQSDGGARRTNEIFDAITILSESFQVKASPIMLRAYELGMAGIDIADIKRACGRAVTEFRWMPKVFELRSLCGVSGSLTTPDRSIVAWASVKAAVATHGGYAAVMFDDPIINATVRALGGWVRICDTEAGEAFDTWLKKDFERTYHALTQSGVTYEQSEPLTGLCDQLNSASGHDARQRPRRIETGLPDQPKHLLRGDQLPPKQIELIETAATAVSMTVEPLPIPERPAIAELPSRDEQVESLKHWMSNRVAS